MSEDDETIVELLPDEEDVPAPHDVPGYLFLQDSKRFAEGRAAWAMQQLVSSEGVLPVAWRDDWKDIVKGLRDGPESLKHSKSKPGFTAIKGGGASDAQS